MPAVGLRPLKKELAHTMDKYMELGRLERAYESDCTLMGSAR